MLSRAVGAQEAGGARGGTPPPNVLTANVFYY